MGCVSGSVPGCQSGYKSGDPPRMGCVSGSVPGCQSGYKSGDPPEWGVSVVQFLVVRVDI